MFKRKRIPVYPDSYVAAMMTAYVRVAKYAIRTGNASEYKRASDMMHEVNRTI